MSVTVRGAGTGLVGSALNDGIILDMKNFDSTKIGKNSITVGPGTMKGNLDKKLEQEKKFFQKKESEQLFQFLKEKNWGLKQIIQDQEL